jgi:integrase
MDASAMYRRFVAAAARGGLSRLRFHDLRHTFGTRAITKADIRRVQEWMGHADISTTMRYLHYVEHPGEAELISAAFAIEASATAAGDRASSGPAQPSLLDRSHRS